MTINKPSPTNQIARQILKEEYLMKITNLSFKNMRNKRLLSLILAIAMGKLAIMLAFSYYYFFCS